MPPVLLPKDPDWTAAYQVTQRLFTVLVYSKREHLVLRGRFPAKATPRSFELRITVFDTR